MEGTQEVEESLPDEDFKPTHLQVVQSEVITMTTRTQQEWKVGGFKVEQMQYDSLEAEHQTLQREHRELQAEHKRILAEHERLKQEHGTFLAEREKLLAEHETLQAEHTRLQAEIKTVLLEKEVLRKAVEVAESVVRQTSVANGKSREIVIERGDCGDCKCGMKVEKLRLRETASCLVNPTKVKKIQAKSTNCKRKAMKLNSQSLDQHQEGKSSLKTGRKRKQRSSISADFIQSTTPQTQVFRSERKKPCATLDTVVASYDVRPLSSPELTEEEDLKDLEISFDLSSVSSDMGGRPAAVFPGVRPSDGNVEGLDKAGGEEYRGLTNGHMVQTSDPSDEETSTKSCRSRSVTVYKCEDCDRSFRSSGQYDSHRQTHHGSIQTHRCPRCRDVFRSANLLVEHMLTHITTPAHHRQSHTCSHCSLRFPSNTALRKHIHRSHNKKVKVKRKPLPGKEFRCQTCGETFAKNLELSIHMRVHSDGKPLKCSECEAAFTTQSNLAAHARKHSGDKPYRCDECDATFPRSADLKSHLRRHSSVKPHLCSKCPAAFCRAGDLKPHMRTHTGEKPFQCEECGAAFTTSSNLAVHRRTHTGERPFQCEQCGAAFTQLGHLTRHRSQHATENDFRCPVCPAAFGNKYKLKVHMQRHNTDNTFKCHKCGAAFSRASVLTEHLRIHTGEKPYKCSHCPASFARSANLMAHRRKHTGERPYVCPHCKQGFTQSTSLNRHLQSQKACLARQGLPKSNTNPTTTQGDYSENEAGPLEDGRREEEPAAETGQGRALTSTNQEAGKVEMLGSESGGVLQKQHVGGVLTGADADRNTFPSSQGGVQLSSTTLAPSQAQGLCNMRKYESISAEDRAIDAESYREKQGSCLTPRGQCSFSSGGGDCPSFEQPAVSLSKAVYSDTGVCGGDLSPPSNLSPFHQLASNALTEPAGYSDALPATVSLPQHSRGREGTAASFGMTSSRCEATLETVLLPPISTMADFQTDLSGLGSSLTALRNLTPQPNTYLHPHVAMSTPQPPSRVSPPHRQMPNS